ncbi:MAG: hypothetical protein ISR51_08300 [Rhodospirillales bacterium]|nr:hypothetical protein [Rhodospirillales bacterium]
MKKMSLSLNSKSSESSEPGNSGPEEHDPSPQPPPDAAEQPKGIPIIGGAAIVFGILGIFTKGYIFVPLALICSLIALFMGQMAWAFIGLLLCVAGLLTSPVLLGLLGIAWFLP